MLNFFKGTCTAMITPFNGNGVDYENLERQIEYQLAGKIKTLLILGTTGESPTVTHEEYEKIISFTVKQVRKRATVIVGSGSNCTKTAIEKSLIVQNLGADGLLVVTPYYNKCTQQGLIKYYKDITSEVNLPVIAYNVPSRTGVNILPETMGEIAKIPNIAGIKEASGNLKQIKETLKYIDGSADLYSGDDSLTLDILQMGGKGSISVCSNPLPKQVEDIYTEFENGNLKGAKLKQAALEDVMKKLFIEVNPIPVKYAMYLLGLDSGILRPPMTELEDEHKNILKKAFCDYGVSV